MPSVMRCLTSGTKPRNSTESAMPSWPASSTSASCSAPRPAISSRQPLDARRERAQAERAVAVSFSCSSRWATSTTGCRGPTGRSQGTPFRMTSHEAPDRSATNSLMAIWASRNGGTARKAIDRRRFAPRGRAKWSVATIGLRCRGFVGHGGDLRGGHVDVDDVGGSPQQRSLCGGHARRGYAAHPVVVDGGSHLWVGAAEDRHLVARRPPVGD